ncbi:uncharacterized protein FA14DRAFT_108685, partial [Meira miltonrushii]
RQAISNIAGTASFVVWLFAQSPQLYENYKNSSCEGLSFVFLAQWMAGDATNLIGSVLTQQLPFQIAVATYFCCIDVCILIQYYYYWKRDRRLAKAKEKHARQIRHAYRSQTLESSGQAGDRPNMSQRGTSVQSTRSGMLNSIDSIHTPVESPSLERVIGRISAWTCTILYMTSRLPQIWTNMQRKSVQGLSILLFIAAATGNFLYSISILVNPKAQSPPHTPQEKTAYLMESLPFLLGSGGTLIFDAIIIMQW